MKLSSILLRLVLPVAASAQLVSCASSKTAAPQAAVHSSGTAAQLGKPGADAVDELDDYGSAAQISDPLEGMNRVTFKINDGLYTFLLRPVSKGYVAVTPKPVRQGLDNFFDNVKFPVRFVNCTLQGKMKRAGQEVQKFGVNTFAGFGGLLRQSDKIPSLASVPAEDTGQTLGKWGLGNGPYLVLPVFGPSSMRDGVGLAGDYVLNPVNWGFFLKGNNDSWVWIPSTVNNVRSWPSQLELYDEARQNAVDPYISVRSVYIQNREAVVND